MLDLLIGIIGMLLTLAAFVLGMAIGGKLCDAKTKHQTQPQAEEESEEKKKMRIAEQRAFEEQMAYSMETAYRMKDEDGVEF